MINFVFRCWRVLATGFSFILFSFGALLIATLLTITLCPIPMNTQRKRDSARRMVRRCAQGYVRCLNLMGLLTYDFSGLSDLRVKGRVVIANHPTLLDAVFLMSFFPNATSVVKASMATSLFTSRLVKLIDFIPNSLDGEGIVERSVFALNTGQTLFIFPEGTRTEDFHKLKVRRGAANIALAAKCQIQPVFIECQPLTLRKGVPWYKVPPKRPHFAFRALEPIDVSGFEDPNRSSALQARSLTEHIKKVYSAEIEKSYH